MSRHFCLKLGLGKRSSVRRGSIQHSSAPLTQAIYVRMTTGPLQDDWKLIGAYRKPPVTLGNLPEPYGKGIERVPSLTDRIDIPLLLLIITKTDKAETRTSRH